MEPVLMELTDLPFHGSDNTISMVYKQSYRLLVASRLYWLPYPGLGGKSGPIFSNFRAEPVRSCEVETFKRAIYDCWDWLNP
jgi:hypothetical protein